MDAWLNCENLLITLSKKHVSFAEKTTQVIDECAHICLATFHALKSNFTKVQNLALLCVGICEECAEICERYNDSYFLSCAAACRQCSLAITQVATTAID
jgi:hypothetical protein